MVNEDSEAVGPSFISGIWLWDPLTARATVRSKQRRESPRSIPEPLSMTEDCMVPGNQIHFHSDQPGTERTVIITSFPNSQCCAHITNVNHMQRHVWLEAGHVRR